MKFFKIILIQSIFSVSFVFASAELSSLHIAVLEDPTLIEQTPFFARAHVYSPSFVENDKDFQEHGVSVCSVLVGEKSTLPADTSITLVSDLKKFCAYLDTREPKDFVILNWSGCTGYPKLSEDVLEDLENISQHFNAIIGMHATKFTEEVNDYIRAYEGLLAQLPVNDDPLFVLLNQAKTCLIKAQEQPEALEDKRDIYILSIEEKIDAFKKYAQEKTKSKFYEMKSSLIQCLEKHDNTLIVWAIGNDEECIDEDPFWQGLLEEEIILNHSVLVQGVQANGRKNVYSNFTYIYSDHCLGKPYNCLVWSVQKSRYVQEAGTSFSASLVTIDAFLKAKELFDQTGETPIYRDVKCVLLMK